MQVNRFFIYYADSADYLIALFIPVNELIKILYEEIFHTNQPDYNIESFIHSKERKNFL
jgi:hypothetical protein